MKNKYLSIALVILAITIIQACSKDSNNKVISDTFNQDASGWTVSGDAQGNSAKAAYSSDEGVTDGYIYAADNVTGGTWYFQAPAKYLGDLSDFYNGTLTFSLFQKHPGGAEPFEDSDIIFKNGSKSIAHQIPNHPDSTWTSYKMKLNAQSGWLKGGFNGDAATEADIKAVLSHVTGFFIRGEYQTGADTGGLDNVKLQSSGS